MKPLFKKIMQAVTETPFLPTLIDDVECRAMVISEEEIEELNSDVVGMDCTVIIHQGILPHDHPWVQRAVGMYCGVLLLRPVRPTDTAVCGR